MRVPRVPSVQHFARFASRDPKIVERKLRQMAENPPRIGYLPSRKCVRDHLILGVDRSQIITALEGIKGDRQRAVNLGATGAFFDIADHFVDRRFADIDVRYFGFARKLFVPVNPFLYSVGKSGESVIWLSFWSDFNLRDDQCAVFATIMDQMLFNSPDFRGCRLEFVDLSRPLGEKTRSARIIGRSDFGTMTTAELKEYTDAFAEAFVKILDENRRKSEKPQTSGDIYLDQPSP